MFFNNTNIITESYDRCAITMEEAFSEVDSIANLCEAYEYACFDEPDKEPLTEGFIKDLADKAITALKNLWAKIKEFFAKIFRRKTPSGGSSKPTPNSSETDKTPKGDSTKPTGNNPDNKPSDKSAHPNQNNKPTTSKPKPEFIHPGQIDRSLPITEFIKRYCYGEAFRAIKYLNDNKVGASFDGVIGCGKTVPSIERFAAAGSGAIKNIANTISNDNKYLNPDKSAELYKTMISSNIYENAGRLFAETLSDDIANKVKTLISNIDIAEAGVVICDSYKGTEEIHGRMLTESEYSAFITEVTSLDKSVNEASLSKIESDINSTLSNSIKLIEDIKNSERRATIDLGAVEALKAKCIVASRACSNMCSLTTMVVRATINIATQQISKFKQYTYNLISSAFTTAPD